MHRKSETFDKYQDFCEKVEKQLALLIKTLGLTGVRNTYQVNS